MAELNMLTVVLAHNGETIDEIPHTMKEMMQDKLFVVRV